MDTSLEQLDSALQNKDSESLMSLISYKTNSQRIKLREEYKTTFSRDLFEDFKKSFKGEFLQTIIGIFKTPVEYDVDLLNNSLKGFSIDKDVISEIICFRTPKRLEQIKVKYQEKYGENLVEKLKKETSGGYQKIIINLLEGNRNQNDKPDLETCSNIADEIYKAGEGKIGTNEEVFIKYFTTLSKEEILMVCQEYHRKYSKTMLDVLHNEFYGTDKKLLEDILYSIFSPSEYFAREIMDAIKGLGTNDSKLIRCIVSRYNYDMKLIKKYFKKIYQKTLLEEVKDDVSGSYGKILELLIDKHDNSEALPQ